MTCVVDDHGALVALDFAPAASSFTLRWLRAKNPDCCFADVEEKTAPACAALEEFFAGTRRTFHDLPLALRGTSFQLAVWAELSRIPFGETRTYGQIAAALGRPGASRAVGRANGSNPIPLVVPCHRVVGSTGALIGYSGAGGLETKRRLLAFEQRLNSSGEAGQSEMNFAAPRGTLPAAHVPAPRADFIAHL